MLEAYLAKTESRVAGSRLFVSLNKSFRSIVSSTVENIFLNAMWLAGIDIFRRVKIVNKSALVQSDYLLKFFDSRFSGARSHATGHLDDGLVATFFTFYQTKVVL